MHSEANVHGTVQVGHGFGLAQCRAGNGEGLIDHDDIIGTGGDDLGSLVDSVPTVTPEWCNLSQMCSHVLGLRYHPG